jgi:hypothetical protein
MPRRRGAPGARRCPVETSFADGLKHMAGAAEQLWQNASDGFFNQLDPARQALTDAGGSLAGAPSLAEAAKQLY